MRRLKWHIKPRIFVMLIMLLTLVFISVFFAFNLFIRNYIRSNVGAQLSYLTDNFEIYDKKNNDRPNPKDGNDFDLPDLSRQPRSKIGTNGQIFVLDDDYAVISYDPNEDIDELIQIAGYMKDNQMSLENAGYSLVKTDYGEYYVSSMPDKNRVQAFMVFYVNVSALNNLVETVNLSLVIIMAVAMLLCFIVANIIASSVTTPVQKLSKFAVEIGKGNFTKGEFSFTDIEFDDLAEAMNQSAEKLDLYDKDQHAFFQNVSHELRTPLMSIRCYAEGVGYGLMDAKKSGDIIMSETDRLTELVEDLLYISRVDNIKNQVEKQEYDLRETLSLCAESMKSVADKNGLRIEYQFDDNPVLFLYNEKHMYRAFVNLISNALRYAKTAITLRCRQTGSKIEVCIIDDGGGIAAEDIPHIFERFYKGRDGKHGIGLSIVKSVVELHGGEILVNCDQGTCFIILF